MRKAVEIESNIICPSVVELLIAVLPPFYSGGLSPSIAVTGTVFQLYWGLFIMRYLSVVIPLLLLFCCPSGALGQTISLEDDFSDGDFTANPTWVDRESKYIVNSSHLLQLDAPYNTAEAAITTSSTAAYGRWEALIQLDFNPSSSNLSRFYIISDSADLKNGLNGYYIEIGNSGDEVSLYRQEGVESTKIIDGADDLVNSDSVNIRVKATRDLAGNWELLADTSGGSSFISLGTALDNRFSKSEYTGFLSDYTSTRATRFEYDEVKVTKITPPLVIQNATFPDNRTIELTFNLDIDPASVSPSDFIVNQGAHNPDGASLPSTNRVRLSYSTPLPSDKYTISVSNIEDLEGNTIEADSRASTILFGSVAPGDIRINEFLYDPATGPEYIELVNTTDKYLNLSDWEIRDNTGTALLGSGTITIEADSFLVISADTTALNQIHGKRAYLQASSLPVFNNDTDAIQLMTADGTQADSLTYTQNVWGGDGIALERRSASITGIYKENWGPSPNPGGGTPGLPNEVPPDHSPPELSTIKINSSQSLKLGFRERLGEASASKTANYNISSSTITGVSFTHLDSVVLSLEPAFQNGREYTLTISGVEDIFGNSLTNADTSFTYYEIAISDSGDVAINEFMFTPPPGSSEYIEIYNHSLKALDLKGWTLGDSRSNPALISDESVIVPPDSFIVLAAETTLVSAYPDRAIVTMNNFPSLNNSGDQIRIRNSTGLLLDSLEYSSEWGEGERSLERRSIEVPGTHHLNWQGAPNGFGSPGIDNNVYPDTLSPSLESFSVLNSKELLLTFSEQLAYSSALHTSNYTLDGGPAISGISFSSPNRVFLTLNSPLQNAVNYTISLDNITDLFGNTITPRDTTFTFYQPSPVDSGDVFINEFSYDPVSGSTEYVEIYNPSDKSYDLRDWKLSDNRANKTSITKEKVILPPRSYVVIAPDNTLLADYPAISLIAMENSFPPLNNSGDAIALYNDQGMLLDSLSYTSNWGGEETALERRTTTVSGFYPENWGDAPNKTGTPGTSNMINEDRTPPSLKELYPLDDSTIQLIFSERVNPESAIKLDNYRINSNLNIQLISALADSVKLFLSEPMNSGFSYSLTVSDLADIFYNALDSSTREFEYLRIEDPLPGDIVINEFLYDPTSSGQADFVEIYNNSDKNIEISDWRIGDASRQARIPQAILRAQQYLVLTASNSFARQAHNAIAVDDFPSLNNSTPDAIYLANANNRTVDSLHYSQTWGNGKSGRSLERKDPNAATNDPSNWQTSGIAPSIGRENISFQEDSSPPYLIFSKLRSDGDIEVRFNEFIRLSDDLRFTMAGRKLSIVTFDSTSANRIILSNEKRKTTSPANISITVNNLYDIKGNFSQSSKIPLSRPLQKKDVVINEIMYNPLDKTDDNKPDQGEYIELRNTRNHAVSMEGIVLHDAPDEEGEVRTLQPVNTVAKWISAEGYLLIHADEAASFSESRTAVFFDPELPPSHSLMRVRRSSLSLSSTGDAIYIADSTDASIDSVYFDESWQNPNIIDSRGIALERISPGGPSNDDSNWGSSIHPKGGTPAEENTIYQKYANPLTQTGITFTPNPFTPDDDGHNDNLFINYKLDQPDYLIKVQIFDRYGRLISELADGKQAGFEGQLIWDGRKDDGSRNRIGIYIVTLEAYDSATGSDKAFKKTVVLARRLN